MAAEMNGNQLTAMSRYYGLQDVIKYSPPPETRRRGGGCTETNRALCVYSDAVLPCKGLWQYNRAIITSSTLADPVMVYTVKLSSEQQKCQPFGSGPRGQWASCHFIYLIS